MLIVKSLSATAVLSESANPVTVVIAIPVEKLIPSGNDTFAAPKPGIISEKNTPDPAVGVLEAL